MNATELPARYLRLTADDVRDMIAMSREVLAENPENAEMQRHLDCLLAVAGRRAVTDPVVDDGVRVGREAGSPAANQYGVFQVHHASPAQVRYLESLIAERVTDGVKIPSTLEGISKTAASALIDRLCDKPRKAGAATPTNFRAASEKQQALIAKLLDEKDLDAMVFNPTPGVALECRADWNNAVSGFSISQASAAIEALFTYPRKQATQARPAQGPKVEVTREQAGAYRLADGKIVRIYWGQESRVMQCAQLVDIKAEARDDAWKYLGRAERFFAGAVKLTVEECEQLAANGLDHSWCCCCGRRLDDPNSVARSIGPVCRAKQGAL